MQRPRPLDTSIVFNGVLETVAGFDKVTLIDLWCLGRGGNDVTRARHIAMWMFHCGYGATRGVTAMYFGRDESSITYAIQRVEDFLDDGIETELMRCRMKLLAQKLDPYSIKIDSTI